ncbi:hypothetical protein SAY86_006832 [Trapa natans]|uniref:Uncharacterized protein n=1 Tax=Trapa natans TaxID=22666 RepID=A0AAN7L7C9_TRANT|nr:hypothetical protein SAY86_006832 [Trapa natans]
MSLLVNSISAPSSLVSQTLIPWKLLINGGDGLNSVGIFSQWKLKNRSGFRGAGGKGVRGNVGFGYRNGVRAFCFNPNEGPILKEALKEPVAFMGGMFAGLLKLDLNEDPLKEWVTRTVEASGITKEELQVKGSKEAEEAPQEIVIE